MASFPIFMWAEITAWKQQKSFNVEIKSFEVEIKVEITLFFFATSVHNFKTATLNSQRYRCVILW